MYNHFNPGWASKRWGWSRNKSSFYFDASKATFTPKMAKRDTSAMGPFAAGVLVQGDGNNADSLTDDVLSYLRGTQISGNFYPNFDGAQGDIELWFTPEYDYDKFSGSGDHYIWFVSSNYYLAYEYDNDRYNLKIGGQSMTVASNIAAGTTYLLSSRWDCKNDLDGTNYACLSINDTHTFGVSTQPTAAAPGATIYVGNGITTGAASAIIAGFTVYRRPLWDGTYGVDAGNGDEINLIYAAGSGKKPEEVTGGDDIVFQLPTDGTPGELTSGTGEAWSWPSSSNELTNWHLQDDTAGAPDDWTAVNAPTLADAATADILFGTRAQKISVDAADEGIRGDTTPAAGEDKAVWAWVKTGGANQGIDLRIYDNDNAADIVEMTTDATGWTLLNTCYEVPAGCTDVQHFIESTDADTYDIHAAQVQVLPNLVADGGLEDWTDATHLAQWVEGISGTSTVNQDAVVFHSGVSAARLDIDASGSYAYIQSANIFAISNKFYVISFWAKCDSTPATATVQENIDTGSLVVHYFPLTADWTRCVVVVNSSATASRIIILGRSGTISKSIYYDDVSVIELDDVSLTATPASLANATEADGSIRVGGESTLTQPITGLTATRGSARFTLTQRHDAADVAKFGVATPYIVDYYGDASNYIRVYWSAANTVTLTFNDGGGVHTDTWDATGAVISGASDNARVDYNSAGMTLTVDGSVKITIATAIDFSTVPTTAYFGSRQDGTLQIDGTIAAP